MYLFQEQIQYVDVIVNQLEEQEDFVRSVLMEHYLAVPDNVVEDASIIDIQ